MQKAEKLKTYDPSKFRPGFVSVKRNGIHGTYDPNLGFYSRGLKEIKGMSHLALKLKKLSFPVIGELIIPGVDFETISGRVRSFYEVPEVCYNIFDALIPGLNFKERLDKLKTTNFESEKIQLESMHFVSKIDALDNFYIDQVRYGEEGICWKAADHFNQPGKRTWDWMKRIPFYSEEVRVIDIQAGTKGKKYEHSMGNMVCVTNDNRAQHFKVGIFKGQTDAWRGYIFKNRERYIGLMATIEFKAYSLYKIPIQARFKAFRPVE